LSVAVHQAGQWREALRVGEAMAAAGVSWDVVTFNATLSALGRAGQWRRCQELMVRGLRVCPNPYPVLGHGDVQRDAVRAGPLKRCTTRSEINTQINMTHLEDTPALYIRFWLIVSVKNLNRK
jgi:hypothetical protein